MVESDAVALALVKLLDGRAEWAGTAGELLAILTPTPAPKGWPANPRMLVGRLRRLRPALTAVGVHHTPPAATDKTRTHRLERGGSTPPAPPAPPEIAPVDGEEETDAGRAADGIPAHGSA